MDFSSRNPQHVPVSPNRPTASASEQGGPQKTRSKRSAFTGQKSWRIVLVILLFSATVLLLAIVLLLAFGGGKNESGYVQSKDFQAVDINIAGSSPTNQIYFGHIKSANNSFFVLDDIYYFPASSGSSTSSATLEPLVCQIDVPYNQMVINRASVVWWENLQPNGKVASTITKYEKDNPKGPSCPSSSSNSSNNSANSNSSASTGSNPTSPTTPDINPAPNSSNTGSTGSNSNQ